MADLKGMKKPELSGIIKKEACLGSTHILPCLWGMPMEELQLQRVEENVNIIRLIINGA